jgi:DNA replication protein DnaC
VIEQRKRLLANIPSKFASAQLEMIQPDPLIHPKQASILSTLRANPEGSYFFAGRPGKGKSLFMWALYRYAVEKGVRRVVVCTLSDLLEEYRSVFRSIDIGEMPRTPRLLPEHLQQNEAKYAIFLDDIDKANATDYAAEQVYRLVNAIYEYGHQLVVTTNKSERELIDQYNKRDSLRGEPIVRRMIDGGAVIQMFETF